MAPLVRDWDRVIQQIQNPLRLPRHPLALAHFSWYGLRPATSLARGLFTGEHARGLFAGMAAHSMLPLDRRPSAAAGLLLALLGTPSGGRWSVGARSAWRMHWLPTCAYSVAR
jgi:phytoene dehydrogenase-like protein